MCGLIGACSVKKKHTGHHIINLYRKQDTRGKRGFGYLSITKGKLTGVHRSKTEAEIIKMLSKDKGDTILFHHRMPTSTKNTLGTTHPIFVSHDELKYDYYFAHNGIISNAKFLKDKHNKLGYVYKTEFTEHTVAKYVDGSTETLDEHATVFNDSESLAIELARYIEELQKAVYTTGAAAFWGISLEKNTNNVVEVFYGKNKGRDLASFSNNKWIGFSSETGADVEPMKIFSYSINKPDELYERELDIDTAEPARTVGFNRTVVNNVVVKDEKPTRSESWAKFEPADQFEAQAYENLQNSFYTMHEIEGSGVPAEQFFKTPVGDGYTFELWLPIKFAGKITGRVPYSAKQYIPPFFTRFGPDGKTQIPLLPGTTSPDDYKEPHQSKEMEMLEDHVLEYIKIEEAIANIETAYTNNLINENIFDRRLQDYQAMLNVIEEKFATLGIDSEVIEDKLAEGRTLIDYDNSFLPPMEGVRVI